MSELLIPSLIHPDELVDSYFHRNDNNVSHPFHRLNSSSTSNTSSLFKPFEQGFVYRGNGNFDYIKDSEHRDMLRFTWKAIEATNMWSFLEKPNCTFSDMNNENISFICYKIKSLGYYGHTKKTLAFTLRCLQYIAQYGENEFKKVITY
jgi:hypothetical protein